jgi:hypothetical protein
MHARARQCTPEHASARQSTPVHARARQCTPEHSSALEVAIIFFSLVKTIFNNQINVQYTISSLFNE